MLRKGSNWLDGFLNTLQENDKDNVIKKTISEEDEAINNIDKRVKFVEGEKEVIDDMEEDITAEININDLPSIIWNDEEYKVLFNENGTAEILNDFGNHVTTVNGKTIDEVNQQLGDRQIVVTTQINKLLNKIASFKTLANEISDDLLSIKQEYARIDKFEDTTFDSKMLDYENMMESIKLTTEKITKDNNIDRTHRKDKKMLNIKEDNENDIFVIQLNENDENKFKEQICPNCNNQSLVKTDLEGNYQYIKCNECGSIYKVNMNDETIWFINE